MIQITVDTKAFSEAMDNFQKNQLPFALKNTLNYTALDFQKAERDRIAQNFTLRRPDFILNTVKIERGDFATKEKLEVIVSIDPTRDLLAKFEDGGVKESRNPQGSVAIPVDARINKNDIITPSNRPKAFQLQTVNTKGGYLIAKGLKRVFLIKGPDGKGEIFQRVGKGKTSRLKLLYDLTKRVPIPKALGFMGTAEATVNDRLQRNFDVAFADAMRTAR